MPTRRVITQPWLSLFKPQNNEYRRRSVAWGWHSFCHASTPQRICSGSSRADHHCREKTTDKRSPWIRVPLMAARISKSRKTVRAISKAFTLEEKKKSKLTISNPRIISWYMESSCKRKRTSLIVDEEEMLQETQASSKLKPKGGGFIGRNKGGPYWIRLGLWKASQRFVALYHQQIPGSWTLEDHARPYEEEWEDELLCELRSGCCARECGCCQKPR